MKATLKPTGKPGTFGITIDDMTEDEASALLYAIVGWKPLSPIWDRAARINERIIRPVLEAGIAAVKEGGNG